MLLAGVGLLAAIVVVVLATGAADVTARSPIRPAGAWRPAFVAALALAFAFYVVGVALLARSTVPLAAVVVVATVIQLAPLAAPLLLSTDAYSYWDYGRVAAVHGGNPYADRPSRWPEDPAYRRMGADWRERLSVYGPTFTLVSEGGARVAGDSPGTATLFFRLLAAVGMLALIGATALAADGSALAAAFVGWNPLLALHFAGGGHNDVLMMALVIGALLLGRRRLALEGAAWAGALSVKAVALLFLPLRLLVALKGRRLHSLLLGLSLAAAALALVASLRYGGAWLDALSPAASQLRRPSSLGLPYWLGRAGVPTGLAADALLALFALLYVWLLREAWHGRLRLGICALGLLVATSWLQPWYAVWVVPLAAVDGDRVARLGALVLTGYFLLDALPL